MRASTHPVPACPSRLLLLLFVLLACAWPAHAQADLVQRVEVTAFPERLVYGDDNKISITVTLYGPGGTRLTSDGDAVYLNTTLGDITNLAYTVRGQVTVNLRNDTGPGRAIVTATVGSVQGATTVEYLGQGYTPLEREARPAYRLNAESIYYSVDQHLLDLSGDARFVARGYTITAESMQYQVSINRVSAQGAVTITAGDKTLRAAKFALEPLTGLAHAIITEPDVIFCRVDMATLEAVEDEAAKMVDFAPPSAQPTRTWIISRSATLLPNNSILFRRPEFYVNHYKMFGLPYHVLDLNTPTASLLLNSQVALTSDAGLHVDFPVYYAADTRHTGSLHLRNVTKASPFYRGSEGVQIGIEEEYLWGDHGDGGIYFDDLTRETRSVSWDHHQDFARGALDVNAAYERYAPDTPYATRAGLSASHRVRGIDMRLAANWHQFDANKDLSSELNLVLPEWRLSRGVPIGVTVAPFVGYTRSTFAQQITPEGGGTPLTTLVTHDTRYEGISSSLGLPIVPMLGGKLVTRVSHEVTHMDTGEVAQYLDADISLRHRIANTIATSVGYGYSWSHSTFDTVSVAPVQRLHANITGGDARAWQLSAYADYKLGARTLFASSSFLYRLPWDRARNGDRRWFVRYDANINDGGTLSTTDQLLTLGRNVGAYNLLVHYSPSGNTAVTGIGTGTGKQWTFEITRQGW